MPRARAPSNRNGCAHQLPPSSPSSKTTSLGHRVYSNQQILTAMTGKRKHRPGAVSEHDLNAFPAPLVLPDDAIDIDPRYPTQSFRSWLNEGVRNQVTTRRNVLYVAVPPKVDADMKFIEDWSRPKVESSIEIRSSEFVAEIDVDGVLAYLRAFYHGLEVKTLPTALTFAPWNDSARTNGKSGKKADVEAIALATSLEAYRVRVRSTPPLNSESPDHLFPYTHQLDLNDLTSAAMSMIPPDAYALILLTNHDIYESDDDDFCCGRAWGASRIAIVSGARYQPVLDSIHEVDREHMWPASHCKKFLERMTIGDYAPVQERSKTKRLKVDNSSLSGSPRGPLSPLEKALEAHIKWYPTTGLCHDDARSMFLFRLCRTASHELGHCFGLDHCMYKACVMQGTASVAEDMRQPMYLCPVCEAKVTWAIVRKDSAQAAAKPSTRELEVGRDRDGDSEAELAAWKRDRHTAIRGFCEQYESAFAPLLAWTAALLERMHLDD